MSILAISQTLGSLGDAIGREVARSLGYEFADREIIFKAAERFGQAESELVHVTDEKPTLWERFAETTEAHLIYVEAIIWELAARDNVVLVGRGAPFLLRTIRHALRVRVTAPEALRAQRVETDQGLTHEAAPAIVQQSDRERAARIKYLYHVDWDDPLLYDLCVNTERLSTAEAVRLVQDAVRAERCQPTPESVRHVEDSSVTARAKAALLVHPVTKGLVLSVTCTSGQVSLTGQVGNPEVRRAAEEVIRQLPGVTSVRNEIVVAPPIRPSAAV